MTDSRGNNFDVDKVFQQPTDFRIDYCIIRGATVNELKREFLQKISGKDFSCFSPIIVKIAVGINNFTKFTVNTNSERELTYSGATASEVFSLLLDFKSAVKSEIPTALVGLVTVPPVSLKKYHEYCIGNKSIRNPVLSDAELTDCQQKLNDEINSLNDKISYENCEKQEGHLKGCRTVSWHRSIYKLGKIKRGKKYQKIYKNDFRGLYDGLHAKSDLKQKWFKQLLIAIRAEIGYTQAEIASCTCENISGSSPSQSEGSDTEQDESWDFKRTVVLTRKVVLGSDTGTE